jgi:hypothetical protein
MKFNDFSLAIYKLYPQTVRTVGDTAYDSEGNEVAYDKEAVTEQAGKDQCSQQAKSLLAQSDWSVLPDVGLKNSADFITYRGILRGLATQPQVNPDFPVEPTPVWQ